jgi:exonuclease III
MNVSSVSTLVQLASRLNSVAPTWNVRRLNNPTRRQVVKELVSDHRYTIVCFQATKLQVVDGFTIANTISQAFLCNSAVLLAVGTRGGVVFACSQDQFSMMQVVVRNCSVTATVTRLADSTVWTITAVYVPQDNVKKMVFLQELWQIKQSTNVS